MSQPIILQAAIDAGCSNPPGRSRLHGSHHWKCVAEIGFYLVDAIGRTDALAIDRDFIATFALLHDVQRRDDGIDFNHGLRAGLLFQWLVDCGRLRPGWNRHQRERVHAMHYALRNHCNPNAIPTQFLEAGAARLNVAICWDADRLCRYRLHETPSNDYLSTRQARTRASRRYASDRCSDARKASWSAILSYPGGLTHLGT
jgi:hypothetical protein